MWLEHIFSIVGGATWARAWCGPAARHWLVAGSGASLWVGIPWYLPGASRGCPWWAGFWRFLWRAASMRVRLCVARLLWGVRRAAGAWLMAVPPMASVLVRPALSLVAPLGGPLLRCLGGGLGLGGSWEGGGHAGSGWLWAGGRCAGVWALLALRPSSFPALVSPACLLSDPFAVLSLLLPSAFPAPLFCFFFGLGDPGCLRAVEEG